MVIACCPPGKAITAWNSALGLADVMSDCHANRIVYAFTTLVNDFQDAKAYPGHGPLPGPVCARASRRARDLILGLGLEWLLAPAAAFHELPVKMKAATLSRLLVPGRGEPASS